MSDTVIYRCDGCGREFTVASEGRAEVVCLDCDRTTTPCGDRGATIAYRVGYARYREGRRQLSSGMDHLEERNWVDARALFDGGADELEDAVEEFTHSVRRADGEFVNERAETARQKATCLWQVAGWLSGAAYARENHVAGRAESFQTEAREGLQRAREYGDLAEPERLLAAVAGDD